MARRVVARRVVALRVVARRVVVLRVAKDIVAGGALEVWCGGFTCDRGMTCDRCLLVRNKAARGLQPVRSRWRS